MAESRLCSIPDCGKAVAKRGWCNAHYLRWHRHGDPLAGRPSGKQHSNICRIDGCENPAWARGWCGMHYQRWRTKGNPLRRHRVANGDAFRFYQEVVLPYDGDDCLIWPYAKTPGGYGQLWYEDRLHVVSCLVCEAANGARPNPEYQAAHSCGKGHEGCVAKRHLSWKTPVGNAADKIGHGTQVRGSLVWKAKLTIRQVREIRRMKGTLTRAQIGKKYGVSETAIRHIHNGKNWAWLP